MFWLEQWSCGSSLGNPNFVSNAVHFLGLNASQLKQAFDFVVLLSSCGQNLGEIILALTLTLYIASCEQNRHVPFFLQCHFWKLVSNCFFCLCFCFLCQTFVALVPLGDSSTSIFARTVGLTALKCQCHTGICNVTLATCRTADFVHQDVTSSGVVTS